MAVLQVTIAALLFLFVDDVAGKNSQNDPIPRHEAWTCSNTSNNTSLRLSCPDSTDWFHIVREEFSFTGNCTTGIYRNSSAQDTGSGGLSVSCLGPQTNGTCEETVEVRVPQFQNAAEKLVKVTYECVKDDLNYNICDDVSLQVDGAFYLASPDFFTQPSDNDERQRCHCVLETRSAFRGLVLYLGNASNLLLACTESQVNSVPSSGRLLNQGLILSTFDTQIKTLNISLKNVALGNDVDNSVWIVIKGEGAMNLQCNGYIGMSTESLPSSVSTPMPKSDTTDGVLSSDGADNTRKDTHAYVIAGVAGAVLIVLLVFLLIMIARRRQKMTKAEGDATEFQQNSTVRLQELAAPSSPDVDVTSYASENYARLAPAEERNRSDDNATYTPLRPPVPRTSQGGNEHETHAPNCGAASEGPENHYYSSLARPEDRQGMDNDNYTLLPPRYVNFQQQQQPQRHQQQLRPVGAEDTIQYSNLITEQTAGDSPEAMDNTDDSYLHPVGCLTTTD